MDETLVQINSALNDMYEALDDVQAGSEEHKRLVDAIKQLEDARSERMKVLDELEGKGKQMRFNKIQLGITAIAGIFVPLYGILTQRRTNKDLMEYEEDNVMTHKGYDNNVMKFLNIFRR